MVFKLVDIINIILLFQLSISITFLFHKGRHKISNLFLIVFFVSHFFVTLSYEFYRNLTEFYYFFPFAMNFGGHFILLFGASLNFYVRFLCIADYKLKKRHLIHLIPFVLSFIFFTLTYHIYDRQTKQELLDTSFYAGAHFWWYYFRFIGLIVAVYNINSLLVLRRYENKLKENYTNIEDDKLNWLRYVLYLSIPANLFAELVEFSGLIINPDREIQDLIIFSIVFVLLNLMFYKTLVNPDVILQIKSIEKYKSSNLTREKSNELYERIQSYMNAKRPFVDSNLTLKDLADRLEISSRHLSQIINEQIGKNFHDFINEHRINLAIELLKKSQQTNKTVSEILYEVGFNSKASFYEAFKKKTGTTPSAYKKLIETNVE